MKDKQIKPLSMVQAGETVKLAGIEAGRDLNSRLASMGLVRRKWTKSSLGPALATNQAFFYMHLVKKTLCDTHRMIRIEGCDKL